jgi:hypothetical protein
MSFGFKTTWLAVRDRPAAEVADALGLTETSVARWDEGVDLAYQAGVFVTPPVDGWTLAHGRRDLSAGPMDPGFEEWVTALSRRLGEVQVFTNDRVGSHYGWAWAKDGVIVRAFAVSGGPLPVFLGAVTAAEILLGRGLRTYADEDWQEWGEEEWDAWYAQEPNEFDVLKIAGLWSVDPSRIEGSLEAGIYGMRT